MRPAAVAVCFALAACSANPAPVPVSGSSRDLGRLAGEWAGEYSSEQTGRSGSITFRLQSGTDSAWGDVVMIPAGRTEGVRAQAPVGQDGRPSGPQPALLSIRFVQVVGGSVGGVLDPYTDPDCGCTVYTSFTGRLNGDRIDGEFVSRHSLHAGTYSGRWSVQRRR